MAWPFGKSKAAEQVGAPSQSYVRDASAEPDEDDVQWLASIAGDGDLDRARWELRYARRAFALHRRGARRARRSHRLTRRARDAPGASDGPQRRRRHGRGGGASAQPATHVISARRLADRSAGDSPDVRVARVMLDRVGVRDVPANMPRAAGNRPAVSRGGAGIVAEGLRRRLGAGGCPPVGLGPRTAGLNRDQKRADGGLRDSGARRSFFTRVPKGGLEPPRAFAHWLLKPARLPVPPLRQGAET